MRFLLPLLLVLSMLQPTRAEPDLKQVLPRWRQLVQEAMARTGVPGCSVAVVYQGQVVMLEGFGVTDLEHPSPVDADTVFRLASCSKPVATTTVAALVGEGKLTWDTPIHELDPGFALNDPWVTSHLTVRDLCSHRSGLPGQAGNELEDMGWDQAHVLHALRDIPLDNRFRSSYSYSNFGITAGVEAATHGKFQDQVVEKVFVPLGMTRSRSRFADFAKLDNTAREHVFENGKAVRRFDRMPDVQAPAGGIYSSARDLTRFVLLHLGEGSVEGRQIIAKEALVETHQPVMLTGFNPATFSSGFYGLGWAVSYDKYGMTEVKHSGAFSTGSRSQILMIPQAKLGVVILSNAFPSGLPEALSQALVDLSFGGQADLESVLKLDTMVGQGMAGMVDQGLSLSQRPSQPRPPGPPSRYEGAYASDYFGPARVENMQLSLGPDFKLQGPLQPWDGDTFFYQIDLSDGPLVTLVRFEGDGFTLENLNDFKTGHFQRVQP